MSDYEAEALRWVENALEAQMDRPDLSLVYATIANTYAVLSSGEGNDD
jgi:hypothetical protein